MQPNLIKSHYLPLSDCFLAGDVVVVIDVLRAFSAEAFAFDRGVTEIVAVGSVEAALAIKRENPDVLVMGEVNGYRVEGFDLWNSPAELNRLELAGRKIVHRTTAGTQGIIQSEQARVLLAASFVCARATARFLKELAPADVFFIITGQSNGRDGDEDAACAEYIAALLNGKDPATGPFLERVYRSDAGKRFFKEEPAQAWLEDMDLCVDVNRFDFVMRVFREHGQNIVRKINP
jgi:2-phosphosulfolactate phosphatase